MKTPGTSPPPRSVPLEGLAASLTRCGLWGSTRGLMFTRPRDRALLFTFRKPSRVALHMVCVFYAIDVLFLDSDGVIVDIRRNFRPFTACRSRAPALYVVELPRGRAKDVETGMRVTGLAEGSYLE